MAGIAMSRRTYTDQDLRDAVGASRNVAETLRTLGLFPGGGNYETVQERIRELGLDTSHFPQRFLLTRFSDDAVIEAVKNSRSIAASLRKLGIDWTGNRQRTMKLRIERLGIDTSHFLGQGWRRGATSAVVAARPLCEILVLGRKVGSHQLKERLLKEGIKERRCEVCRNDSWNGRPIPLELDHVNGRREDNRIQNLRILCPNCHAQTETYRGRNIGLEQRRRISGARVA
jgi:hypothetical protein